MVKKSGHTLLQTVTCSLSIALWLVFRRAIVHTPSRYEPPWQDGESDELDKAVDIYHVYGLLSACKLKMMMSDREPHAYIRPLVGERPPGPDVLRSLSPQRPHGICVPRI